MRGFRNERALCARRIFAVFFTMVEILCAAPTWAKSGSGYTYYQKLTGEDSDSDKGRWDAIYRKSRGYVFGKEPATILVENLSLLPVGRVLDIAMGEGRNSVYLAKKGFDVTGVDISLVAIQKAKRLAHENGVHIKTVVADLNKYQIEPESFDVIVCINYLQRSLVSNIVRGLRPGGVLVFENDTLEDLKYDKAQDKAGMLKSGELRSMFKGLHPLKFKEIDDGKRAYAVLVARKQK